ncbi:MAG: amidophosphoribosyltransferase [Verrucomicrobiota bacterium JB022]|nr:amidophosphoribosyltransferase [Verrucomicrobiota bacterium JB022]
MSDSIKHECGIAMIRLKQPLEFYAQKYGSPLYAFNKLFLLMEKQHNRGQDGAGIGCVKLHMPLGQNYMFRDRELADTPLAKLFRRQLETYDTLRSHGHVHPEFPATVKRHFDFGGEVLMGHLRYGTSGNLTESSCHPYFRRSNWPTRNLMVAGNFNMTNTQELNDLLIKRGQHPIFDTDTQTVLEEIGFHLDEAHDEIYHRYRDAGLDGRDIPARISQEIDIIDILKKSAAAWDGGYVICGLVGNGDAFVMRDPRGIRPAHYFENDELIAVASERVPLMTVFDLETDDVNELPPGHALSIKSTGRIRLEPIADPVTRISCSFERIYFSRGNDPEIYMERKRMGALLSEQVLKAIDNDVGRAVFSFIPNTAEIASYGLVEAMREWRLTKVKDDLIQSLAEGKLTPELIETQVMGEWPRIEKIAHKDIKLRTFISKEEGRSKLVSHVYDITYDVVRPDDNLIVLDDSIVRGTTLRESIIQILARTNPKKIIIVSTAPQIRYPDCYGIDMSEMGKFIAFQAAVSLLHKRGAGERIRDVYEACKAEVKKPAAQQENKVKDIYALFTPDEVSAEISALLYPQQTNWKGELQIIYQTIDNLHAACPGHMGDWYFTGNYPTPGGTSVANKAFINYFEKRSGRAY